MPVTSIDDESIQSLPLGTPNIFDQFDTPTPTIAPDAKNPFDAFDGNVFDQFDKPAPLKFANLPGDIKLNPLQRIQLQTRLQDPENPTGQDNTFLTALSEGGSPLAFAKNLATLPFALPMSAVSESIKPFAAPIMNALADVGEADTPIVQPKGEPSAADVVMYQLGLGKKRDNYQPDEFFQPGEPMLPKELFPYADETQRGILPAATRALLGMSTPENALLAGAAPLAPEAIGGGFFAGTVASIPDSLQRLATARNGEDFKDAATELGLNLGMAVLMAHGLIPKPGPVMTPEEAAANRSAVLASLPPGFEKSANSALPPLTTTDWAQGPAPDPNATNPLRYEQPGTPILQNKDDLEAAVQNLQNILRGKLPLQEQPTVNNPSDQADQIIRNIFPQETRPLVVADENPGHEANSVSVTDRERVNRLRPPPEPEEFPPSQANIISANLDRSLRGMNAQWARANIGDLEATLPVEVEPRFRLIQQAAPEEKATSEGISIEQTKETINQLFGTRQLPPNIRVIQNRNDPSKARIDQRGSIYVNAAKISTPEEVEQVALGAGLHAVWPQPEVQSAWQNVLSELTTKGLEAAFIRRKAQELPPDPSAVREEAATQRVTNIDGPDRIAENFHNAIRAAFERKFGTNLPATAHPLLKEAVNQFLRERVMQGTSFAGAPAENAAKFGSASKIRTIRGRKPINSKYAGRTHPSGVKFTYQGFPDFSPYAIAQYIIDGLTGIYEIDEAKANEKAGLKTTPDGYVWHHVEDGKTMQLIPKKIHRQTRHTGGAALIRNGGFDNENEDQINKGKSGSSGGRKKTRSKDKVPDI